MPVLCCRCGRMWLYSITATVSTIAANLWTLNDCNFLRIHANAFHYVTDLFLFFIVLNVMYFHKTRHFQILRFELGNIVSRSHIYQITLKHCHEHLHDPLVHSSHFGAIGGRFATLVHDKHSLPRLYLCRCCNTCLCFITGASALLEASKSAIKQASALFMVLRDIKWTIKWWSLTFLSLVLNF